MDACKIMIADDHAIFRDCIRKMLIQESALQLVGEAEDGAALLDLLERVHIEPDLVLLDISMPKLDGIATTRRLKLTRPHLRILILSIHSDAAYLRQAFDAGADGYLLKDDADTHLIAAICAVCHGGKFVSPSFACDARDLSVLT
jgi:DNA-binding NarL/FixJ family response regulator